MLYCHLWFVWLYHALPHYLVKDTIFGKTLLIIKYAFWFSLQRLSAIFLILSKIQRSISINIHTSARRVPVILELNFLGQSAASRCEGFPTFREITLSSSSGCPGSLVVPNLMTSNIQSWKPSQQFCCYQTTNTLWRWGRSCIPKRRTTFTSWRGSLPEKISLNSVAAKVSTLISVILVRF